MDRITRRAFLSDGTKLAAGMVIGTGVLGITSPSIPNEQEAPQWPWKYVTLDPQAVAQKAYESYYEAGCMYGAFNAIVVGLREKVGAPYTLLPTMMARYGEGGGVGWATLCGALNGAGLAMTLVSKDYASILNELIDWYTLTAFPIFKPAAPKVQISATSTSDSPLCHVSVTEWCKAAKAKSESPERAERCARVAADVASQAVQLLNKQLASEFKVSTALAPSVQVCSGCHLKGGIIEDARGKMDCVSCHDPKELPQQHPIVTFNKQ